MQNAWEIHNIDLIEEENIGSGLVLIQDRDDMGGLEIASDGVMNQLDFQRVSLAQNGVFGGSPELYQVQRVDTAFVGCQFTHALAIFVSYCQSLILEYKLHKRRCYFRVLVFSIRFHSSKTFTVRQIYWRLHLFQLTSANPVFTISQLVS